MRYRYLSGAKKQKFGDILTPGATFGPRSPLSEELTFVGLYRQA